MSNDRREKQKYCATCYYSKEVIDYSSTTRLPIRARYMCFYDVGWYNSAVQHGQDEGCALCSGYRSLPNEMDVETRWWK